MRRSGTRIGTFYRATQQGVTHNAHVHTGFTSGGLRRTVIFGYSTPRESATTAERAPLAASADFSNNCLFVLSPMPLV